MLKTTITDETKWQRLDVFVAHQLPQISRAFIRKLCDDGYLLVNGQQEKAGYKTKTGDVITLTYDLAQLDIIPDIELPILYEDDDILVVNKPVGVISHARGRYFNESSVASFVRQKTAQTGERSGIVHRLDRATSGAMICSKNEPTMSWLQKQFSGRNVKKTYMAVVAGHLKPAEAVIDMPIERNPKLPSSFHVGENGKQATTSYRVVQSSQHYDLVELRPLTGRTHQLRVHLKQVGHPIVGDTLYQGEPAERLYLHALSLEITLPSGKLKTFEAPLPQELTDIIQKDT